MLYLFTLLFIEQNIINKKIVKYIIENSFFLFVWVFKMKMSFLVLEIWLFGDGKVLEIFLKEFVRTMLTESRITWNFTRKTFN